MKAFFCSKNTKSECLKKFNSSFTVNKAVKNSIFSCKGTKESFHLQNADFRYILDEVCIEKEYLTFGIIRLSQHTKTYRNIYNKYFLWRSCTEKLHA